MLAANSAPPFPPTRCRPAPPPPPRRPCTLPHFSLLAVPCGRGQEPLGCDTQGMPERRKDHGQTPNSVYELDMGAVCNPRPMRMHARFCRRAAQVPARRLPRAAARHRGARPAASTVPRAAAAGIDRGLHTTPSARTMRRGALGGAGSTAMPLYAAHAAGPWGAVAATAAASRCLLRPARCALTGPVRPQYRTPGATGAAGRLGPLQCTMPRLPPTCPTAACALWTRRGTTCRTSRLK